MRDRDWYTREVIDANRMLKAAANGVEEAAQALAAAKAQLSRRRADLAIALMGLEHAWDDHPEGETFKPGPTPVAAVEPEGPGRGGGIHTL